MSHDIAGHDIMSHISHFIMQIFVPFDIKSHDLTFGHVPWMQGHVEWPD